LAQVLKDSAETPPRSFMDFAHFYGCWAFYWSNRESSERLI